MIYLEEQKELDKFWFVNNDNNKETKMFSFKTALEYIRMLNSLGIKVNFSHVDTDMESYL